MMNFVTLFQATQDRDGVFDIRLIHLDFLKTTFKGGVRLYVFAILIQGRGTDTMQLTPSQRRLQHIARVHRAFGLASTHHRVNFIDKENDATLFLR